MMSRQLPTRAGYATAKRGPERALRDRNNRLCLGTSTVNWKHNSAGKGWSTLMFHQGGRANSPYSYIPQPT